MVETTNKFIEEIGKVMTDFDGLITLKSMRNLDENEIKLIVAGLKLIDISKELIIKQAEIIDDQNRKLDLILSKLEKRS